MLRLSMRFRIEGFNISDVVLGERLSVVELSSTHRGLVFLGAKKQCDSDVR